MVFLLNIAKTFEAAATNDEQFQKKPVISIEAKTFEQVLEPVNDLIKQEAAYDNSKANLCDQMEALRQICKEGQVTHQIDDSILKQNRNKLLNTLQGFIESFENKYNNYVSIEFDDIFNLSDLTDIIRSDAKIYREFMNEPLVAKALERVSDNIDLAQTRRWHPDSEIKIDINQQSSNDEIYSQQDIA